MQLTGLTLAQALATIGIASAITLTLYLLRSRRRRVQVPFIELWETLLRDRRSSRLFQSMRHLISLLIALLVVWLLSLAIADPRQSADSPDVQHVLLLVDAGATMQTTDVDPSRLAVAVKRARALVASAGPQRRMLVAQFDASVTPLSPMTGDRRLLDDALDAIEASDTGSDHQRALDFATSLLAGRPGASAVMLSDLGEPLPEESVGALAAAGIELQFVPIGKRNDNVAISAFALRRYPLDKNRSELLIELHNSSDHAEQVELTLGEAGRSIDVQRLELGAGARVRRIYDDVTGVREGLVAHIEVLGEDHDDLALDDSAHAVVPERRPARVLCVTAGNRYLEAALLLDEYLDVDVLPPEEYLSASGYDVVIFDGYRPGAAPSVPALYVDVAHQERGVSPVLVGELIERPYFEQIHRRHPLVRFTALTDVNLAVGHALTPQAGDDVIARDRRGALFVAGQRAGVRFAALGFDIRDTDLPLRVAWPVLLMNIIDWFTLEDDELRSSYAIGETATLEVPEGIGKVVHVGPLGGPQDLEVRDGRVSLTPERVGFHRLEWDGGGRVIAAVLNGETQRDLTPMSSMRVAGRTLGPPPVPPAAPSDPPWVLLALGAFALLMIEWFTFHRRWTV